jgi:signal transduction histidine kinase
MLKEFFMNYAKLSVALALPCLIAQAQNPTSSEAVALVKAAVAYAKKNGVAKLIEETNSPTGKFHVATGGELYIFIYDERGTVKAIGYNTAALVGKNRIDLKDPDGVYIIRELIKVARGTGKGWVDYKYPNPTTNTLDAKTSYLEFYEGAIIGSGIYKEKE